MAATAILDQHGKPYRVQKAREQLAGVLHGRSIKARYDAAQTTHENTRHWGMTDALSADMANSLAIRKKLRERARYEYLNNAYCRGMVETLAADVIGTGPRLQVVTGAGEETDKAIEKQWAIWAAAIRFARKLRSMCRARAIDGEGVAMLTTKERRETPITLNVRDFECDRMQTPEADFLNPNEVDGIRFDEESEPYEYDILREHPGAATGFGVTDLDDWVPATDIVHMFRQDRPEQHRGIPQITAALPLFALLRRYTLAELSNQEINAEITAVLKTVHPELADYEYAESGTSSVEPSAYTVFDVFDIERNSVLCLPAETDITQFQTRQSATTYAEFKREILAECFATLVMPFNVGAHDSSEFNYASGKLDRLTYGRIISVDRSEWESVDCLFKVLASWFLEAKLYFREWADLPPVYEWATTWHWDGIEDIDPAKAANARSTDLKSGSTTLPRIYASQGHDYEAEQIKGAKALGLTLDELRKRQADVLYPPPPPAPAAGFGNPNGGNGNAKQSD